MSRGSIEVEQASYKKQNYKRRAQCKLNKEGMQNAWLKGELVGGLQALGK